MQTNVGGVDRLARFVIGLILAILVIANLVKGVAAVIVGIIAILLVFTSLFGFCALYVPFKFSTTKKKSE